MIRTILPSLHSQERGPLLHRSESKGKREVRPGGRLVGFNLSFGTDKTNVTIKSVQPIWESSGSESKGKTYGSPTGGNVSVKAKTGCAVGAMEGRGGTKVDFFQLTFMKVKFCGQLDPSDSYKSDWYGGKPETTLLLTGYGLPVKGNFGGNGSDLNSRGLLYELK